MIASVPLTGDKWLPLACSELIVARQGKLVHRQMLSTHGSICEPIQG